MDKNADGRITQEEVQEVSVYCDKNNYKSSLFYSDDKLKVILRETYWNVNDIVWLILQIIALSASANKLSKLQERSDEYAALIMEELDPDNLGYIEVCVLSNYWKLKNTWLIWFVL